MTILRILHVDDEADIRELVQIALSLDPHLVVRSCASGEEAMTQAAEWRPDLILCDVMMPVMDGPATLARLREHPATAAVPVIFMTARVHVTELKSFIALGAIATIEKPFDPMSLAQLVRHSLTSAKLATVSNGFGERLRRDRARLTEMRTALRTIPADGIGALQTCAHKLAGAAGIFGRQAVSDAAARLEEAIIARRSDLGQPGVAEAKLDALIESIDEANADGA
jgi:CheY-like chemotaxis protein